MKPATIAVKPCPLCAGQADLITYDCEERKVYYVACMGLHCMAEGPRKGDAKTAIACWNQRPKAGRGNRVKIER